MKAPTNRSAYMDELRTIFEDVLLGRTQRSWIAKKNISKLMGREYYIEYTEEHAPQQIEFQHYGSRKKVVIEYYEGDDGLRISVDGEFMQTINFDLYKNKTAYTTAVAIWVDRYAC